MLLSEPNLASASARDVISEGVSLAAMLPPVPKTPTTQPIVGELILGARVPTLTVTDTDGTAPP